MNLKMNTLYMRCYFHDDFYTLLGSICMNEFIFIFPPDYSEDLTVDAYYLVPLSIFLKYLEDNSYNWEDYEETIVDVDNEYIGFIDITSSGYELRNFEGKIITLKP